MNCKETDSGNVDLIYLAHNKDQWWALVDRGFNKQLRGCQLKKECGPWS
jgi:hypothetical protein